MIKRVILMLVMVVIVSGFVYAEGIDEDTVLMLHMDDAGLTDSSDSSQGVTKNGDAALNTGTYKFSPGSAYFDGTGDYLSIPDSSDWDFGTGDFTIDFWVRRVDADQLRFVSQYQDNNYRWYLSYRQDLENIGFNVKASSWIIELGWYAPLELNAWHHVALVRNGNNYEVFVDGVSQGVTTDVDPMPNLVSPLYVGTDFYEGAPNIQSNGYIDELRISKGIARWTEDFTPPTEPYSAPPFSCGDTVSYEGQSYNTVLIGEQCWFAENLNVGTMINSGGESMDNELIEKYCYNNDENICTTDGGLYQWDEAMQYVTTAGAQGICPTGWHIPTDAEWIILEEYLGMCSGTDDGCSDDTLWRGTTEGDELKKSGLDPDICYGDTPPCGTSGFEGLLTGIRGFDGAFNHRGTYPFIWSSSESVTNAWERSLHSTVSMILRSAYSKAYGFSVRCLYNENITASTTPTTSNFTSTETTNFSAVDVTNVTSMILAVTGKGKIKFPESTEINAEAQDYDTNIIIEDEFISVNTAALDSTFNTSATITLEGVTCPVATITYQEGTFTSKDDIIAGGSNCELDGVCSNIQCSGSTLTFDVAHFTGFAAGADANLTTEAQAGVFYPLDPIEFTAEYINSTDGTPISGECNITFDDEGTWYTMDFDSPDYNYTKSFAVAGIHDYNVTCSSANFVTLEANDTKLVSSVDIPEFSIMTLGLGLIAVLIGLFIMRKRR